MAFDELLVCAFHLPACVLLKCVRERGRGVRYEREKQLVSPTASPIHKEKGNGSRTPQKRAYRPRYSVRSAVKLVRDISSREISDKEVQVGA